MTAPSSDADQSVLLVRETGQSSASAGGPGPPFVPDRSSSSFSRPDLDSHSMAMACRASSESLRDDETRRQAEQARRQRVGEAALDAVRSESRADAELSLAMALSRAADEDHRARRATSSEELAQVRQAMAESMRDVTTFSTPPHPPPLQPPVPPPRSDRLAQSTSRSEMPGTTQGESEQLELALAASRVDLNADRRRRATTKEEREMIANALEESKATTQPLSEQEQMQLAVKASRRELLWDPRSNQPKGLTERELLELGLAASKRTYAKSADASQAEPSSATESVPLDNEPGSASTVRDAEVWRRRI